MKWGLLREIKNSEIRVFNIYENSQTVKVGSIFWNFEVDNYNFLLINVWFLSSFFFSRLVCGDVCGKWEQLYKRINSIQKKNGPFDVSLLISLVGVGICNCVIFKCIVIIFLSITVFLASGEWHWTILMTSPYSLLVQVMAWCHQATSHYLNQCCHHTCIMTYGITWPQWVNSLWPGRF